MRVFATVMVKTVKNNSYSFGLCQEGELERMYGSASSEDGSQL